MCNLFEFESDGSSGRDQAGRHAERFLSNVTLVDIISTLSDAIKSNAKYSKQFVMVDN